MKYEQRNFEYLLGTKGFSDLLLKTHLLLYQGYVTNTNKLIDLLNRLVQDGNTGTAEYAELKRRFGWEFNGMRLHEFYFGNMANGGEPPDRGSTLFKKMATDFGGYDQWEREFKAVGALRGIGWVVMYYDPIGQQLFNAWINEHDEGQLSGARPLLIMDVFEHAYMTDYRLKRADYIEVFFQAIDWKVVVERFKGVAEKGGRAEKV